MSLIHKDVDTIIGYLFGQIYLYDKFSHTKFYNDLYIIFKNYPHICQGIHRSRLEINSQPQIKYLRMHYSSFWISLLKDFRQGRETITFPDDQPSHLKYTLFKLAEIFGYYCVQTNQTQKECLSRASFTLGEINAFEDFDYYMRDLAEDQILYFFDKIHRCNSKNMTTGEKKYFLAEAKRNLEKYSASCLDRLYQGKKVYSFSPGDLIDLEKSYTLEYLKRRHMNWGKMDEDDSWISTGEFNEQGEELFKYNQAIRYNRCFLKNFGGRLKLVKIDVTTEKFRNDLSTDYEDQLQLLNKRKRDMRTYIKLEQEKELSIRFYI